MIMQMRGIRACSYLPECSLSYTMTVQGECSNKAGKRSLTRLDTAEPQPVICNDNASEGSSKAGKRSFTRHDTAEPQPVICNDSARRVQQQGGKTEFYQT